LLFADFESETLFIFRMSDRSFSNNQASNMTGLDDFAIAFVVD